MREPRDRLRNEENTPLTRGEEANLQTLYPTANMELLRDIFGIFKSNKQDKQIANLEAEKARCEAQLASETKRMQEQEEQHKTMLTTYINSSNSRIEGLQYEKQQMRDAFDREKARDRNASHVHQMNMLNSFTTSIKDKDAAIALERKEQEENRQKMVNAHEEKMDELRAFVNTLQDEKQALIKEHGEKMLELQKEHTEEIKEMSEQKMALERETRAIETGCVQSAYVHTTGFARNVHIKLAAHKQADKINANRKEMQEVMKRQHALKKKLDDLMVEREHKMRKPLAVFARNDKAETDAIFEEFAKETSKLDSLIKCTVSEVSEPVFDDPELVAEAQSILNFVQGKTTDFGEEMCKTRRAMVKTPQPVDLGGIVGCLKALDEGINKFPFLATQTAEAAIVEEAARAAINQQEDMKRTKDELVALKGAVKDCALEGAETLAIEPLVEDPVDQSQKAMAK